MTFAPATSRTLRPLTWSLGTIWLIVCLAGLPAREALAGEAPAQHAEAVAR